MGSRSKYRHTQARSWLLAWSSQWLLLLILMLMMTLVVDVDARSDTEDIQWSFSTPGFGPSTAAVSGVADLQPVNNRETIATEFSTFEKSSVSLERLLSQDSPHENAATESTWSNLTRTQGLASDLITLSEPQVHGDGLTSTLGDGLQFLPSYFTHTLLWQTVTQTGEIKLSNSLTNEELMYATGETAQHGSLTTDVQSSPVAIHLESTIQFSPMSTHSPLPDSSSEIRVTTLSNYLLAMNDFDKGSTPAPVSVSELESSFVGYLGTNLDQISVSSFHLSSRKSYEGIDNSRINSNLDTSSREDKVHDAESLIWLSDITKMYNLPGETHLLTTSFLSVKDTGISPVISRVLHNTGMLSDETESSLYPDSPTSVTSDSPTSVTSDSPTSATSDSPTSVTSDSPTSVTSDSPTSVTSDSPTSASDSPTSATSDSPTSATSDSPTSATSDSPTSVTSDSPTSATSDSPTSTTSDSPTSTTSDSPTSATSDSPTSVTSDSPTSTTSDSPTSASITVGDNEEMSDMSSSRASSFKESNSFESSFFSDIVSSLWAAELDKYHSSSGVMISSAYDTDMRTNVLSTAVKEVSTAVKEMSTAVKEMSTAVKELSTGVKFTAESDSREYVSHSAVGHSSVFTESQVLMSISPSQTWIYPTEASTGIENQFVSPKSETEFVISTSLSGVSRSGEDSTISSFVDQEVQEVTEDTRLKSLFSVVTSNTGSLLSSSEVSLSLEELLRRQMTVLLSSTQFSLDSSVFAFVLEDDVTSATVAPGGGQFLSESILGLPVFVSYQTITPFSNSNIRSGAAGTPVSLSSQPETQTVHSAETPAADSSWSSTVPGSQLLSVIKDETHSHAPYLSIHTETVYRYSVSYLHTALLNNLQSDGTVSALFTSISAGHGLAQQPETVDGVILSDLQPTRYSVVRSVSESDIPSSIQSGFISNSSAQSTLAASWLSTSDSSLTLYGTNTDHSLYTTSAVTSPTTQPTLMALISSHLFISSSAFSETLTRDQLYFGHQLETSSSSVLDLKTQNQIILDTMSEDDSSQSVAGGPLLSHVISQYSYTSKPTGPPETSKSSFSSVSSAGSSHPDDITDAAFVNVSSTRPHSLATAMSPFTISAENHTQTPGSWDLSGVSQTSSGNYMPNPLFNEIITSEYTFKTAFVLSDTSGNILSSLLQTINASHLQDLSPVISSVELNDRISTPTTQTFTFLSDITLHDSLNTDITSQASLRTDIALQPSLNTDITLQLSLNADITLQPSLNTDITLQPSLNIDITLQPSLNTDITLHDSLNTDITLHDSLNTYVTSQASLSTDIALQPSLNIDITLQPSLNTDIALQPSLSTDITLQPSLSTDITLHDSLRTDIALHDSLTADITLQISLTTDIILQASLNTNITSQASLIIDITLQPSLSTDISLQTSLNIGITPQASLSTDIVLQHSLNTDITLQPSLSTDIVLQPSLNTNIILQPSLSKDITLQPSLNTDITLQPSLSTDIALQYSLSSDITLHDSFNTNITIHASLNTDIILEHSLNTDITLQHSFSSTSGSVSEAVSSLAQPQEVSPEREVTALSTGPYFLTVFQDASPVSSPFFEIFSWEPSSEQASSPSGSDGSELTENTSAPWFSAPYTWGAVMATSLQGDTFDTASQTEPQTQSILSRSSIPDNVWQTLVHQTEIITQTTLSSDVFLGGSGAVLLSSGSSLRSVALTAVSDMNETLSELQRVASAAQTSATAVTLQDSKLVTGVFSLSETQEMFTTVPLSPSDIVKWNVSFSPAVNTLDDFSNDVFDTSASSSQVGSSITLDSFKYTTNVGYLTAEYPTSAGYSVSLPHSDKSFQALLERETIFSRNVQFSALDRHIPKVDLETMAVYRTSSDISVAGDLSYHVPLESSRASSFSNMWGLTSGNFKETLFATEFVSTSLVGDATDIRVFSLSCLNVTLPSTLSPSNQLTNLSFVATQDTPFADLPQKLSITHDTDTSSTDHSGHYSFWTRVNDLLTYSLSDTINKPDRLPQVTPSFLHSSLPNFIPIISSYFQTPSSSSSLHLSVSYLPVYPDLFLLSRSVLELEEEEEEPNNEIYTELSPARFLPSSIDSALSLSSLDTYPTVSLSVPYPSRKSILHTRYVLNDRASTADYLGNIQTSFVLTDKHRNTQTSFVLTDKHGNIQTSFVLTDKHRNTQTSFVLTDKHGNIQTSFVLTDKHRNIQTSYVLTDKHGNIHSTVSSSGGTIKPDMEDLLTQLTDRYERSGVTDKFATTVLDTASPNIEFSKNFKTQTDRAERNSVLLWASSTMKFYETSNEFSSTDSTSFMTRFLSSFSQTIYEAMPLDHEYKTAMVNTLSYYENGLSEIVQPGRSTADPSIDYNSNVEVTNTTGSDKYSFSSGTSDKYSFSSGTSDKYSFTSGTSDKYSFSSGTPDKYSFTSGTSDKYSFSSGTSDKYSFSSGTPDKYSFTSGTSDKYSFSSGTSDKYSFSSGTSDKYSFISGTSDKYSFRSGTPDKYSFISGTSDKYSFRSGTPDKYSFISGTPDKYSFISGTSDKYSFSSVTPDKYSFISGTSDKYSFSSGTPDKYSFSSGTSDKYSFISGTSDKYNLNSGISDILDYKEINLFSSTDLYKSDSPGIFMTGTAPGETQQETLSTPTVLHPLSLSVTFFLTMFARKFHSTTAAFHFGHTRISDHFLSDSDSVNSDIMASHTGHQLPHSNKQWGSSLYDRKFTPDLSDSVQTNFRKQDKISGDLPEFFSTQSNQMLASNKKEQDDEMSSTQSTQMLPSNKKEQDDEMSSTQSTQMLPSNRAEQLRTVDSEASLRKSVSHVDQSNSRPATRDTKLTFSSSILELFEELNIDNAEVHSLTSQLGLVHPTSTLSTWERRLGYDKTKNDFITATANGTIYSQVASKDALALSSHVTADLSAQLLLSATVTVTADTYFSLTSSPPSLVNYDSSHSPFKSFSHPWIFRSSQEDGGYTDTSSSQPSPSLGAPEILIPRTWHLSDTESIFFPLPSEIDNQQDNQLSRPVSDERSIKSAHLLNSDVINILCEAPPCKALRPNTASLSGVSIASSFIDVKPSSSSTTIESSTKSFLSFDLSFLIETSLSFFQSKASESAGHVTTRGGEDSLFTSETHFHKTLPRLPETLARKLSPLFLSETDITTSSLIRTSKALWEERKMLETVPLGQLTEHGSAASQTMSDDLPLISPAGSRTKVDPRQTHSLTSQTDIGSVLTLSWVSRKAKVIESILVNTDIIITTDYSKSTISARSKVHDDSFSYKTDVSRTSDDSTFMQSAISYTPLKTILTNTTVVARLERTNTTVVPGLERTNTTVVPGLERTYETKIEHSASLSDEVPSFLSTLTDDAITRRLSDVGTLCPSSRIDFVIPLPYFSSGTSSSASTSMASSYSLTEAPRKNAGSLSNNSYVTSFLELKSESDHINTYLVHHETSDVQNMTEYLRSDSLSSAGQVKVDISQSRVGMSQVDINQTRVGMSQVDIRETEVDISQTRVGMSQVDIREADVDISQTRVGMSQVDIRETEVDITQTRVGMSQIDIRETEVDISQTRVGMSQVDIRETEVDISQTRVGVSQVDIRETEVDISQTRVGVSQVDIRETEVDISQTRVGVSQVDIRETEVDITQTRVGVSQVDIRETEVDISQTRVGMSQVDIRETEVDITQTRVGMSQVDIRETEVDISQTRVCMSQADIRETEVDINQTRVGMSQVDIRETEVDISQTRVGMSQVDIRETEVDISQTRVGMSQVDIRETEVDISQTRVGMSQVDIRETEVDISQTRVGMSQVDIRETEVDISQTRVGMSQVDIRETEVDITQTRVGMSQVDIRETEVDISQTRVGMSQVDIRETEVDISQTRVGMSQVDIRETEVDISQTRVGMSQVDIRETEVDISQTRVGMSQVDIRETEVDISQTRVGMSQVDIRETEVDISQTRVGMSQVDIREAEVDISQTRVGMSQVDIREAEVDITQTRVGMSQVDIREAEVDITQTRVGMSQVDIRETEVDISQTRVGMSQVDIRETEVDISQTRVGVSQVDIRETEVDISQTRVGVSQVDIRETEVDISQTRVGVSQVDIRETEVDISQTRVCMSQVDIRETEVDISQSRVDMSQVDIRETEVDISQTRVGMSQVDIRETEVDISQTRVGMSQVDIRETEVDISQTRVGMSQVDIRETEVDISQTRVGMSQVDIRETEVDISQTRVGMSQVDIRETEVDITQTGADIWTVFLRNAHNFTFMSLSMFPSTRIAFSSRSAPEADISMQSKQKQSTSSKTADFRRIQTFTLSKSVSLNAEDMSTKPVSLDLQNMSTTDNDSTILTDSSQPQSLSVSPILTDSKQRNVNSWISHTSMETFHLPLSHLEITATAASVTAETSYHKSSSYSLGRPSFPVGETTNSIISTAPSNVYTVSQTNVVDEYTRSILFTLPYFNGNLNYSSSVTFLEFLQSHFETESHEGGKSLTDVPYVTLKVSSLIGEISITKSENIYYHPANSTKDNTVSDTVTRTSVIEVEISNMTSSVSTIDSETSDITTLLSVIDSETSETTTLLSVIDVQTSDITTLLSVIDGETSDTTTLLSVFDVQISYITTPGTVIDVQTSHTTRQISIIDDVTSTLNPATEYEPFIFIATYTTNTSTTAISTSISRTWTYNITPSLSLSVTETSNILPSLSLSGDETSNIIPSFSLVQTSNTTPSFSMTEISNITPSFSLVETSNITPSFLLSRIKTSNFTPSFLLSRIETSNFTPSVSYIGIRNSNISQTKPLNNIGTPSMPLLSSVTKVATSRIVAPISIIKFETSYINSPLSVIKTQTSYITLPMSVMGGETLDITPPITLMGMEISDVTPSILIMGKEISDLTPPISVMGKETSDLTPPSSVMGGETSVIHPPILVMGGETPDIPPVVSTNEIYSHTHTLESDYLFLRTDVVSELSIFSLFSEDFIFPNTAFSSSFFRYLPDLSASESSLTKSPERSSEDLQLISTLAPISPSLSGRYQTQLISSNVLFGGQIQTSEVTTSDISVLELQKDSSAYEFSGNSSPSTSSPEMPRGSSAQATSFTSTSSPSSVASQAHPRPSDGFSGVEDVSWWESAGSVNVLDSDISAAGSVNVLDSNISAAGSVNVLDSDISALYTSRNIASSTQEHTYFTSGAQDIHVSFWTYDTYFTSQDEETDSMFRFFLSSSVEVPQNFFKSHVYGMRSTTHIQEKPASHLSRGFFLFSYLQNVPDSTQMYQTSGHMYPISGHMYQTSGHMYQTSRHMYQTSGHMYQTSAHMYQTSGHMYQTSGHMYQTSGHMNQTSGHMYQTSEHMFTYKTVPLHSPWGISVTSPSTMLQVVMETSNFLSLEQTSGELDLSGQTSWLGGSHSLQTSPMTSQETFMMMTREEVFTSSVSSTSGTHETGTALASSFLSVLEMTFSTPHMASMSPEASALMSSFPVSAITDSITPVPTLSARTQTVVSDITTNLSHESPVSSLPATDDVVPGTTADINSSDIQVSHSSLSGFGDSTEMLQTQWTSRSMNFSTSSSDFNSLRSTLFISSFLLPTEDMTESFPLPVSHTARNSQSDLLEFQTSTFFLELSQLLETSTEPEMKAESLSVESLKQPSFIMVFPTFSEAESTSFLLLNSLSSYLQDADVVDTSQFWINLQSSSKNHSFQTTVMVPSTLTERQPSETSIMDLSTSVEYSSSQTTLSVKRETDLSTSVVTETFSSGESWFYDNTGFTNMPTSTESLSSSSSIVSLVSTLSEDYALYNVTTSELSVSPEIYLSVPFISETFSSVLPEPSVLLDSPSHQGNIVQLSTSFDNPSYQSTLIELASSFDNPSHQSTVIQLASSFDNLLHQSTLTEMFTSVEISSLEITLTNIFTSLESQTLQSTLTELSSSFETSSVQSTLTELSSSFETSSVQSTLTELSSSFETSSVQSTLTELSSSFETSSLQSTLTELSSSFETSSLQSTLTELSSSFETSSLQSTLTELSSSFETSSLQSTLTELSSSFETSSLQSTLTELSSSFETSSLQSTLTELSSSFETSSLQSTLTELSSSFETSSVQSTLTELSSSFETSSLQSTLTAINPSVETSSLQSTLTELSSPFETSSVQSTLTELSSSFETSSLQSTLTAINSSFETSSLQSTHTDLSTSAENPSPTELPTSFEMSSFTELSTFFQNQSLTEISTSFESSSLTVLSTSFESSSLTELSTSFESSPLTELSTSFESSPIEELSTSFETSLLTELSTLFESPSLTEFSTSFESSSLTELSTPFESPSWTELSTSFESPSLTKLSTLFESPSTTELSISFENSSPIELSTSFESSSPIELSTLFESPSLTELSTLFESPSWTELSTSMEPISSVTESMQVSQTTTETILTIAISESQLVTSTASHLSFVTSAILESSSAITSAIPASTALPNVTQPIMDRNDTENWVVTTFRIRPDVDITSAQFKTSIEKGLANCYYLARRRSQEIKNGTYIPLSRRRRFASADADNSTRVDMISSNRNGGTPSVDVVYVVEENGQILTATSAVNQLRLLSDQEVAIQTGYVVSAVAKPYTSPASEDDMTKWIIIGCVVGGVVFIIIIIVVIILCCCCGCCKCCSNGREAYKVGVTNGAVQANQSNRAAKMSFSSPQEDDVLKAEQGNMSPAAGSRRNSVKAVRSKRNSSVSLEKIQNSGYEPPKAVPSARKESATPQAVKKKKKDLNTEQDIHLVYASQMASMNTTNTPETYSHAGATSNSQPTVEEESDLLENAEEERKKNKKRAREKKMKEKEHMSPVKFMSDLTDEYKQVQTEVDKILQAPGHEASMRKKSKQQKLRKKDKDKVEDNDDVGDEMESLEKARERMHKLLDDAFSVLSQSRSSMANKVEPARQNADDDNSATKSISRHDQVLQNDVSTQSEKAHTPIEVIRSRKPHEHDALVTWSPYRGYDETALISLPNTETNLGARPAELESTRTAVFEESLPYSLHSNYYATEPAEPIVIKTKNQRLIRPRKERRSKMDVLNLSHQHGHYEQPSLNASSAGQIHFQNPSYDDSLPSRSTAEYLDPYYGLSSYQEVPTLTVIPKLTNENEMNGKISSSRESLADDIVYSDRSAVVNLSHKDGTHTPPVRGENKNVDAVDIIKDSLRPGASPQLLINSLREELQALSSRRTTNDSSLGDPSTHISEITHPDKSRQKRKHRNGVLELKTAYPIDSSEV